ncbi:hypothetical protein K493DRAFT_70962 [Basidiobolus meristosporus CBS 931.73]|uniref:Jacalin-type lectin domain-containing protein n=1 Tax=Basidiobolus meristosporus CBS 931.73 TaxID=1314790 RepID=A0A1Y1YZK8_9FUNG|nr:hypothetical protein K493DRAFT_70962 [Basidiobolus meristosporus CBS 931.73]|eukprot:ORY03376.1 hypothetical protein K493DRAFT_70962 [Basidiobolus meristosporus CBS 931.73]
MSYFAAPRISNVQNGENIYQRVLLVYGQAGPEGSRFESEVEVQSSNFPPIRWPVVDSHFKCLVHLEPGTNQVVFSYQGQQTVITLNYVPPLDNPPLRLVIMLAKDSPAQLDAPDCKRDDCGLEGAIKRFRCAAYLWQAFNSEQMVRNGFGRRTFMLEESYQAETLTSQTHEVRNTAVVHVIRSKRTVQEIRDRDIAQQYKPPAGTPPTDKPSLFSIFLEALREHGAPFDKPCYVAGLIMDSHYDPQQQLILGHAALGGGAGHIRLGMFGSQAVHSWPRCLEEVVPAFTDERCTEDYLANDSNECGVYYKCLNVGMGAFLHEVGHCLTLDHSGAGIMSRGFNDFNKTFVVKEGDKRPILPNAQDEGGSRWHRTDVIRLRYHPCLRLPMDPPPASTDQGASFLTMDNGVLIQSPAGLSMIEYHVNDRYSTHVEFVRDDIPHPTELMIELNEISSRLNMKPSDKLRMVLVSTNQQINELDDVQEFIQKGTTQDPYLGSIHKSSECGSWYFEDATSFSNLILPRQGQQLVSVKVHSGAYIDGVAFGYADGSEDSLRQDWWWRSERNHLGSG